MRKAIISDKNHQYVGIIGFATEVNSYGNVMFYPENGKPYRTCIKASSIQYL